MAARMTRQQLKQRYLRSMAAGDPLTADFYFQAMQKYDDVLAQFGPAAAKKTLPRMRVMRKAGRLDLSGQYLAALKDGDMEKAAKIQQRIAQRDKSGMQDSARTTGTLLAEFKDTLHSLR